MKKTDCGEQLHGHTYGKNVASLSTFRPAEKTSLVLTAPPTGEQRPDWVYCHCGGLTCLTPAALMMLMLILFPAGWPVTWGQIVPLVLLAFWDTLAQRFISCGIRVLAMDVLHQLLCLSLLFLPLPWLLKVARFLLMQVQDSSYDTPHPTLHPHPPNRSSLAYTWCHSSGVLGGFLVLILILSSVLPLQHGGRQCRGCCSVLGSSLIRGRKLADGFCHRTSPSCCLSHRVLLWFQWQWSSRLLGLHVINVIGTWKTLV